MENTAEKLTKLFEKHNREFRFDPQVSHRWIVNAFDEYTKTASGSVAAPKEEEKDSELIAKLKSIQPDFDKLQSYQHGFNDGVAVAIDMVEIYLLTIK